MNKIKILVVEDERIASEDVKVRLEHLGYKVTDIVPTGESAVKKSETSMPDLVLMDIKLQGTMNGIEAAQIIRTRFDIPVVYLTAFADKQTLDKVKETEPFGFILKPFENRELQGVIETALYKHRIDRELREKKAWLSTTLRSIGDAVIATDTQGKITFMNPVAEKLTGWKESEAKGKNVKQVLKIVSEDTGKSVVNPMESVLKKGKLTGLPHHTILIDKKGNRLPIDDSGAPIQDDKGHTIGVVMVFKDISDRRGIEEALKKSEAFYREVIENAVGVPYRLIYGSSIGEGYYDYVGSGIKELMGYTPEEFTEKRFIDSLEEVVPLLDEMPKKFSDCRDAMINREIVQYKTDILVRTKDGKQKWLNDSSIAMKDEKTGKSLGSLGILVDITERKQVEQALREKEERFRELAQLLPQAIFETDLEENITYNNLEAYRIFGYTQEEFKQNPLTCLELMIPEDRERALENIQRVLAGEKLDPPSEYTAIRKDGSRFPVMIYSNAILRNNVPVGIRGIMIDMTDRKKAETQIQKDLKEKEVLLKEIHHRVKNNLQIISSLLGLQARYIQDEKFLNIFKECQNRVRSMALVHEKLYQARDLAIIDFQEYVDYLIRGLYRSYGVSPEQIPYKIHVEDITIAIDLAVPCGLIINELVSNALKYAFPKSFEERGKIDIKLHQIGEKEVELAVRDNGIGLPKNIDLRKTNTLGLQLVTLLAESQLAGTATCDRKKGTRFQIRFPI